MSLEQFPHLTERPENVARRTLQRFYAVQPFQHLGAGFQMSGGPAYEMDTGLLVTSGSIRVEMEGEEKGAHQLYFPDQFCLVPAGKKASISALVPLTSFCLIHLKPMPEAAA